jgi:hypothetical protein
VDFTLPSATPCLHATPRPHTRAQASTHAPTCPSLTAHHYHRYYYYHHSRALLHLQRCSSSQHQYLSTTAVLHSLSTAPVTSPSPPTNTAPSYPNYLPSYHDFFGIHHLSTCESRQIGIQYRQLFERGSFFTNTTFPLSSSSQIHSNGRAADSSRDFGPISETPP